MVDVTNFIPYDGTATGADIFSSQEQESIHTYSTSGDTSYTKEDPIKRHHSGAGDPNGLRQKFNRKGKRF